MSPREHQSPRIAIIGAGPAGCTLARLLLQETTLTPENIAIFERETTLHERGQGGTLDLHDDTGLAAVRRAGLHEQFAAVARFDGDAFAVRDKRMTPWLTLRSSREAGGWGPALGTPEVDRLALRALLLDALPAGVVRWGRAVAGVDAATGCVRFVDGGDDSFDLVVGADGASSAVRRALTPQQPFYSGVAGWNLVVPDAEARRPLLHKLVNRGSFFAFSDGRVVLAQQLGDGSIYVSVWAVRSEDWMQEAGFDVCDGRAVKAALLEEFRSWAPEVREMIAACDEAQVWPRSLAMLPVGFTWESKPGVTILGDAAHVMTPFVGEGVNGAMKDAMELADAIGVALKRGWTTDVLGEEIQKYEQGMFRRIHKVQKKTEDMMKLMLFTDDAPRTVMDKWIVRSMSDELDAVRLLVLRLAVFVYYFFFKIIY
ncbi:uncharacterized protein K452DRAFT_291281 [Neofusicoccum parvum]|nr:uncharacterized protein K452DRAFT_291281 [Neofusicoccum parvum]